MQRLLTADGDGDVAGSANSIFAIFGFRPTRDLADRSDRGGADEIPGHRQGAASKAQRHRVPGLLNWLASRAREGSGGFGGGGFLFRDYQIGGGLDLLRGEVAGRCQSHPGSIDRGVEPPLVLLAAKPRVRERAAAITAAAITAIDLLDLLAPAVWRGAGGAPSPIVLFGEILDRGERWRPGGDRRC